MKRWLSLLLFLGAMLSPPVYALESVQGINLQDGATADGNGGAVDVTGYSSIGLDITITDTATVNFETAAFSGGTFRALSCKLGSSSTPTTTATASGNYQCNVAGFYQFRARISGYSAGTVTVKGQLSTGIFAGGGGGGGGATSVASSTTLPATCTVGDVYVDTDATSGLKFYYCDTTDTWAALLTTAPPVTLDDAFDSGKTIDGANSLANAVRIGDGSTPICIYTDATLGPQVRACTDADVKAVIPTNFNYVLYDEEGTSPVETIDPDAATVQGKYTYASAYRPLKTIWIPAGAMSTDGTQCAAPAEVTINSGAKRWTIICADNDSSTIYFEVEMPDSWDGGTVTVMWSGVQTAADTSNMNSDIALACRVDGDTINNTWGTEVAIDTAMGGSNKIDTVTSGAVTPNGTCTGAGTLLQGRWQLDATGTTTAVATLHTLGFKIEYSSKSRSD